MNRRYKQIIGRRFSRSQLIITVCVVVIIFLSTNLTKEIINRHQIDEKIKQYESDVIELEQENKEISELINSWTISRQLEKEARLKFGLKKPGENVVVVQRGDISNGNTIDPSSQVLGGVVVRVEGKEAPNYKKWWDFFFKKT